MDLNTAIASLPPAQMAQLGQSISDELAVETLGSASAQAPIDGFSPSPGAAALASTPPVTLSLSPAAQQLLSGQVSGLQISQLEKAAGLAVDPQAAGTMDSSDPADPFGTGPLIDDGFSQADGSNDEQLARALGEFNPWTSSATAPNPASSDATPTDQYSSDPGPTPAF
jgi:hypothetical protein